jgi:Uma2 family endonuclease
MKAKVQLLLKKVKRSPDISWNEKEELKYKGETVQESNVVELVNDVLSKRKYFNPQEWETFGEALREANVRFENDLSCLSMERPIYIGIIRLYMSTST